MMMIGITLSLGAILVAWAGQSYGAFSGGSQLFYQQREQALQENFVIEEVFFEKNTTSQQIFVFVRNVGLININVTAIYANGASLTPNSVLNVFTPCSFSGTGNFLSVGIGVQSVCEFTWQPVAWTSGTTFTIVVASQRGNQVASTWRAP
jgi:archaellum component FlaF (FlaF/FlaG flagellin family)